MEHKYEWEIRQITTKNEFERMVEKHGDELTSYEWLLMAKSPAFKIKYVSDYIDKQNWNYISTFYDFTIEELIDYEGKYLWYPVSAFAKLTRDFILNHVDKLSLDVLCKNQNLSKEDAELAFELKKKYDDPKHHKIWDDNAKACTILVPKNFKGNYDDYPGSLLAEEKKKQQKKKEKESKKKKSETIKSEKQEIIKETKKKVVKPASKKSEVVKEQPKKVTKTRKPKIDVDTLNKAQCKEILDKHKVKYLYHDTIAILRDKVKNCL